MQVRVTSEHKTNYPNPIRFERGERVRLGRRDTQYSGWIRVTTADGNEGWAPEQFVDRESGKDGIANRTYSARELDTKVGQPLTVHAEINEWYWVETEDGDLGWVPKTTVT